MSKAENHSSTTFISTWVAALTSGVIVLIGFLGLLFSTVMFYPPFNFDTFLGFTDAEIGFASLLWAVLFAPFVKMCLTPPQSESGESALLLFFVHSLLISVVLIVLTWVVIEPVEMYYSNNLNGGSYTISHWLYWVASGALLLAYLCAISTGKIAVE